VRGTKIALLNLTLKNKAMENSNRNKPGKFMIAAIALLILVIISYLVVIQLFPNFFMTLPSGAAQPVDARP